MPAPSNTTSATAVDLGAWPINYTQGVTDSGVTYTVWFKFTAAASQMVNLLAWGGGGTYIAWATLYASDATSVLYNLNATVEQPWQFPVVNGETYYVKVESGAGDVADGTLTITGALPPTASIAAGDLLINDDWADLDGLSAPSLYAAVLDPTDGTLQRFMPMVAGEQGDSIEDGSGGYIYGLTNDDEDHPTGSFALVYYDSTLAETSRPYTFTGSVRAVQGNVDRFYVADGSPTGTVKAIGRDGTVLGTWTMPVQVRALAANRANTILYFAEAGTGKPIRRWDLVNDVALSNLVAAPANYGPDVDFRVLANDHVIVTWVGNGIPAQKAYHAEYLADGTLVRDYNPSIPSVYDDGPRIALNAEDDSAAFWSWSSGLVSATATYTGRFTKFSTADGSVLETFDVTEFERGRGPSGLTANWPTFGNSKSCPLLVIRGTVASAPTITDIPPFDCGDSTTTQTVTITGTNFGSNPSVTATDPNGDPVTFTITSHTTTQIVGTVIVATCGVWSFTVTDTDTDLTSDAFLVDTGTPAIMRRQRRFLLPFDQNQRIFLSRLELLAQTGVGLTTGQGSDPVILLRLSKDGGFAWGNETQMSIGKIGQYFRRVFTSRLGVGRQWVAEVTISDPVWCALLDCFVDAQKGTS